MSRAAAVYPDNPAVIHHERKINYRDLDSAASKLAACLKGLELPEGSRIAICFENSIEYVICCFAVFKAGFVAVPVDTSLHHEKLNYVLTDCQAQVLLAQAKYQRVLAKLFELEPPVRLIISDRELRLKPDNVKCETFSNVIDRKTDRHEGESVSEERLSLPGWEDANRAPRELAAIFYTSGSTGESKGVMLSHRNLMSNTIGTVEYLGLSSEDSVIVILPFYYIYGNSLLLTHVAVGGTLVLDNRFMYPEVVLDTMDAEKVTGFSGVPSNFMILLNTTTFPTRKFEHLRYFTQAGGAMAPEVIRKLCDSFPTKQIYIMYGQTEASPRVTYLPPERLADKLGSVGIEVPGVRVKIVKDSGEEASVGEEGEIAVGGDSVMMGYWNQPKEQQDVLKGSWLFTGDLAKRDSDGFIYIVGRKKEIIKSGGNRVSVKEIEECLLLSEKIHEVAVFGVSDDLLGEAVKAVVVLKDGCEADDREIKNHCRLHLAEHKIPRYVEFRDSLPKYQSGKVNKMELAGRVQ